MSSDTSNETGNPLGMYMLSDGGTFVLPPMPCSRRRQEYFRRANRIFSTYATITAYASAGEKSLALGVESGQITDATPVKLPMGHGVLLTTYSVFRAAFREAGGDLASQVFLMIYGNFEAYLGDLVQDALTETGSPRPLDESIALLAHTKWAGKLDRIAQRFGLTLGHRRRMKAYESIDMGFLGRPVADPVEFLQHLADVRHLLVHSAARADARLSSAYPQSGLAEGDTIRLPLDLPYDVHFFLVPFTDFLDEAFCSRFQWQRPVVYLEKLPDTSSDVGDTRQ